MCIPPTSVKAAQAKAFAASGLVKDARLNVMKVPYTSFNPIGFLELPIFLTLAFLYRAQFETKMLGPMFLIYLWKECIPMSVCLHRYFSHKGFKCGRATQFALYIGGCLASQVRNKALLRCHRDAAGSTPDDRARVSLLDTGSIRNSFHWPRTHHTIRPAHRAFTRQRPPGYAAAAVVPVFGLTL